MGPTSKLIQPRPKCCSLGFGICSARPIGVADTNTRIPPEADMRIFLKLWVYTIGAGWAALGLWLWPVDPAPALLLLGCSALTMRGMWRV